jgi:hypothetical protein
MDCRIIGERSDAVLRTAKPGNDEGEDGDDGKTNKKKRKEAERRQTQMGLSAPAGAGRATERSACADPPLRARSPVGVPPRFYPGEYLIAQVRLQAMLPGTWV